MKLPRGYRVTYNGTKGDYLNVTLSIAWWRALLVRLLGRRGLG